MYAVALSSNNIYNGLDRPSKRADAGDLVPLSLPKYGPPSTSYVLA